LLRIKATESALGLPQAEAIVRELYAAAGIPLSDDGEGIELVYAPDPAPTEGSDASILITSHPELTLPDIDYSEVRGRTVPILFPLRKDTGSVSKHLTIDGTVAKIGFDLPLAAYRLLSGLDEETASGRDKHGRIRCRDMPGWYSEASRIPVVTYYVDILIEAYEKACAAAGIPPVRAARWPGGAPYAVAVSHDVDQLTNYNRRGRFKSVIGSLTRFKKPPVWDFISRERPYDTLDSIFSLEGKYGAKSTFFVGGIKRGPLDYNYSLEQARPLLKDIAASGAELALHSSYYCNGPYQLTEEVSALSDVAGAEVNGVRGHYLRTAPERLWRWAKEAGLEYDASLGHFDDIGFRRLHCLPFAGLSDDDSFTDIYEVPMTLMDGTLFQYLGFGTDEAAEAALDLQEEVKSTGGHFSVLWHYRAFPGGQYPEWAVVLDTLLAKAEADSACFLTHAEAVERRKGWARFGAVLTKRGESTDAVLSGEPGTSVIVPDGWSAGDARILTVPATGELKVTFKPI
jgi:peptidoglycan/xylan/chitin deacetylase (PgdA/CDA1 family)